MYNDQQNKQQTTTPCQINAQTPQKQAQLPQFQQRISTQQNQITNNNNNQLKIPSARFLLQNENTIQNQSQIHNEYRQQQLEFKSYQQSNQRQFQYKPQRPISGLLDKQPNLLFGGKKSNINYTDDEMIQPMEINETNNAIYDLITNLEFSVKVQFKMGKFNRDQVQYLPAMVTLKTKEVEENKEKEIPKVGVDLICIIDRSSSMRGEKIQMVKKTLKLLLNFLTEKDRLCLIQFNEDAQRLTKLLKASIQNKEIIENTIDQIQAKGQTNISTGTHIAFEQIKKRKYRNKVTSIFLLSDGQDDSAEQSVRAQMQKLEEDLFTIHSFGFGSDNDAKMMTSLCNLKNGSFYFVKDISLLDEFFVDALGGLVSVVGENIEISMKLETQAAKMGLKISKTYGAMWEKINDSNYKIKIPQIAQGSRKDYVFELFLPNSGAQINDNERVVQVINGIIQIKSTYTGQTISKQSTLNLTFFNENEEIPNEEGDYDVAAQYYRVRGADTIDDARKQCEQNQFSNAEVIISSMIYDISKNQKVAEASEGIIQDLQQARLGTIPKNFEQFGQQQMCQMATNNYAQAGINANFNELGIQQQQFRLGTNQNKLQNEWVQRVQTNKY